MKHSLYISPIFSLGIVAPLRHVLTRGNCQLNYGQKHLKCPSEHRTPNDLKTEIGAFRDFGLTRFRPVLLLPGHGRPRSNCANLYVQPRSHVLLDLSLLSFWMFLGDLLGIEPGQNCDLMRRGILVSKKMQQKSQLHQNQLVRSSQ